ncbi:MAG: hypothetical protein ABIQ73_07640 [Acidimicrobiales bacterium]
MRPLLIVLTALEIVLFVVVLAIYLNRIAASLQRISAALAKVTFGVRAIESQTAPIGPGVVKVNGQLAVIAGALDGVATLAEQAGQAATTQSTAGGDGYER